MAGSRRDRRTEFFRAGLEVLAKDGSKAVSAARLSRELNVTTGCFFWHFESVEAFHRKLMKYWQDVVLVELVREAEAQAEGDSALVLEKLRQLIRTGGTYRHDAAMRRWAKTNPDAAAVVEAADLWRVKKLRKHLEAAGVDPDRARDRVNLLGAAWLGSQGMQDSDYRFKLAGLALSGD